MFVTEWTPQKTHKVLGSGIKPNDGLTLLSESGMAEFELRTQRTENNVAGNLVQLS